jgi:hypothetical protein
MALRRVVDVASLEMDVSSAVEARGDLAPGECGSRAWVQTEMML